MVDLKKEVVEALSAILPVYFENAAKPGTAFPCITYNETANADTATGTTFGFSTVAFTVKVWGYTWADLTPYCTQVDAAMRGIGFTRTGAYDLALGDEIEKVMDFEKIVSEHFERR